MSDRYPIVDVVRFKYPLAVIKRIELSYNNEGQCVEEIVTISNNPQATNRSFLEEPGQQQIPTVSSFNASGNHNQVNQSHQQWLTSSNYWAIAPLNSLWVEPDTSTGNRLGGVKRQYNRQNYSNQPLVKSENELNALNDPNNN